MLTAVVFILSNLSTWGNTIFGIMKKVIKNVVKKIQADLINDNQKQLTLYQTNGTIKKQQNESQGATMLGHQGLINNMGLRDMNCFQERFQDYHKNPKFYIFHIFFIQS